MRANTKHRFNLPLIPVLVLLVGFLLRSLSVRAEQKTPGVDGRPNILLVMSDDWSWPYAGVYGDSLAKTSNFDRIAREGILFTHVFCPAPSCTPSRLSILTGQYPHCLNEGANHMIKFPKKYAVYPELLEQAGYHVGIYKKGANFGTMEGTGWMNDPAGKEFINFIQFLDHKPDDKPFCFWYGSTRPHRPYQKVFAADSSYFKQLTENIIVPGYLPDCLDVRLDLYSYYNEIYKFDLDLSVALNVLEKQNLLDNTIIIVTSDNGMPFPRGKATCYDAGMRMPMAIMWPGHIKGGHVCDEMIHLSDLAPTILEAAGLSPPEEMTAVSFYELLADSFYTQEEKSSRRAGWRRKSERKIRDAVFFERERHALGRSENGDGSGMLSYPIRGIRTKEYLYLINLRPHLWPACDPPDFKDVDPSPSKSKILSCQDGPDSLVHYFELSCGKRPQEELYDLSRDPYQLNNLAGDFKYRRIKRELWWRVKQWMADTSDPRAEGEDDRWDNYEWSPFTQTSKPRQ